MSPCAEKVYVITHKTNVRIFSYMTFATSFKRLIFNLSRFRKILYTMMTVKHEIIYSTRMALVAIT